MSVEDRERIPDVCFLSLSDGLEGLISQTTPHLTALLEGWLFLPRSETVRSGPGVRRV